MYYITSFIRCNIIYTRIVTDTRMDFGSILQKISSNTYKYFSISYHYYFQKLTSFVLKNIKTETLMFSIECTWYVLNHPAIVWIYRTFIKKRHRKNDLRMEPVFDENSSDRSWISVCDLNTEKSGIKMSDCYRKSKPKKGFEFHEQYYQPAQSYLDSYVSEIPNPELELHSVTLNESDVFHRNKHPTIFQTKHHTNSKLFLYHFVNNEKIVKIVSITPSHFHNLVHELLVISKVKFIDIQYHHPDMSEPLILELSRDYYYSGNQLFSDAFVYRMLLYQPFPFVFDDRYTLEIMDSDLETMTLKPSEYLVLDDTSYRVV